MGKPVRDKTFSSAADLVVQGSTPRRATLSPYHLLSRDAVVGQVNRRCQKFAPSTNRRSICAKCFDQSLRHLQQPRWLETDVTRGSGPLTRLADGSRGYCGKRWR